jgi:N,N'-diacetyllegionaminate synthase
MDIVNIDIAGNGIGPDHRTFIVAEVGINHGGDVELAKRQIEAAHESGADAVKLQTFRPELFISRSSPYYGIFEQTALSEADVASLVAFARDRGILLFSAVFDQPSADLWESHGAALYKIASGDLTHLPLLRHVASFGKPMLISTGSATLDEIVTAVDTVRQVVPKLPVAVFHCISQYPTDPSNAHLAAMATIRARVNLPVGFSDHTSGLTVPCAAVALGASMIEKHFTHDCAADGPDHALSLDPAGFASMVAEIRNTEAAIGSADKQPVEGDEMRNAIRRSVTAFVDIPEGQVITADMLAVKRPGDGIQPGDFDSVIGRHAKRDLTADETLSWNDLTE